MVCPTNVAHVSAYSEGYVQPLVCSGGHLDKGSNHITEERRQAYLGGVRRLQAQNSGKYGIKNFGPHLGEQFVDGRLDRT